MYACEVTAPATGVTDQTGFIGIDYEACLYRGVGCIVVDIGSLRDPHVAVSLDKRHHVLVGISTSDASKHRVPASSVSRREVVGGLVSEDNHLCPFSAAPPTLPLPVFLLRGGGENSSRGLRTRFFIIVLHSSQIEVVEWYRTIWRLGHPRQL